LRRCLTGLSLAKGKNMAIEVRNAHGLTLRYHGSTNTRGSRYSVTWAGWNDGASVVRRYIAYDTDTHALAQKAAELFLAWLNDLRDRRDTVLANEGRDASRYTIEATRIVVAYMPNHDRIVSVETMTKPKGE
jgi:hypothetical protein